MWAAGRTAIFRLQKLNRIGDETAKKIVFAMYRAEVTDDDFEAYKVVSSKEYYFEKCVRLRKEKMVNRYSV